MAIETFSHRALIRLPRAVVFASMLDPDILRRCVDGCEQLSLDTDHRYRAVVNYRVGPFNRVFRGTVMVTEIEPDMRVKFRRGSYRPVEGAGAFSGIVELQDHPEGTIAMIEVQVQAPGAVLKLLQLLAPMGNAQRLRAYTERFEALAWEAARKAATDGAA